MFDYNELSVKDLIFRVVDTNRLDDSFNTIDRLIFVRDAIIAENRIAHHDRLHRMEDIVRRIIHEKATGRMNEIVSSYMRGLSSREFLSMLIEVYNAVSFPLDTQDYVNRMTAQCIHIPLKIINVVNNVKCEQVLTRNMSTLTPIVSRTKCQLREAAQKADCSL